MFDGTNWIDPCACNVSVIDAFGTFQLLNPNNCVLKYFDGTNWCDLTCPCECPPGYDFNLATNACELVTVTPATPIGGATTSIIAGETSPSYSSSGARLYEDISSKTFPLNGWQDTTLCPLVSPYCTLGYQVYESAGTGVVLGIDAVSAAANDIFTNSPATTTDGRLNISGIWAAGYASNEWLPVEFCISVPTTKTYIFAIAGDNQIKASITSTTFNGGVTDFELVNLWGSTDPSGTPQSSSVTRTFSLWHMFPITLPAGNHTIKLAGYDFGTPSAFAAEIYNIPVGNSGDVWPTNQTMHALMSSTSVTVSDLEPFILFTTRDLVQTPPLLIPEPGETVTWSCPEGTTFSECYGVPSCISIDSLPCGSGTPLKSTTEINLWFDNSSTMITTKASLDITMSLLESCLLPVYNNDLSLFRERVKLSYARDITFGNWDFAERFNMCLAQERNFQRYTDLDVDQVINLVFTDNSDVYGYGDSTPFDSSMRTTMYDDDIAYLRANVSSLGYDIKGTVFRINTGPGQYPGFRDLVKATFVNVGTYVPPNNMNDYYSTNFNCNLDTVAAGTPAYYRDQIFAALKALGISMPVCP